MKNNDIMISSLCVYMYPLDCTSQTKKVFTKFQLRGHWWKVTDLVFTKDSQDMRMKVLGHTTVEQDRLQQGHMVESQVVVTALGRKKDTK